MKEHAVLTQLHSGEINAFQAYSLLERGGEKPYAPKKARFVKMRIYPEDESKKAKLFLSFIFALPLPLFLARWVLDRGFKTRIEQAAEDPTEIEALKTLLKYAKGTTIDVFSKDATVNIKIF